MEVQPKWTALRIHVGVWVVLAVAAYFNAGSYSLANCWYVLPLLIPPIGILVAGLMLVFPIAALEMLSDKTMRGSRAFFVVSHGTILSIGVLVSTWVAGLAAPHASCL